MKRHLTILMAAMVLACLFSACVGSPAAVRASAASAEAGSCNAAAEFMQGLSVERLDEVEVASALHLSDSQAMLRPAAAYHLRGACASNIARFVMNLVYAPPGFVGRIDGKPGLSPAPLDIPYQRPSIAPQDPHPEWTRGQFLMADRVDAARAHNGLHETFVGLWRTSSGTVVGSFSRDPLGQFSKVTERLTSPLPLKSLSYFPSVHGGIGQLGFVQATPEGVRLISADWPHPDL